MTVKQSKTFGYLSLLTFSRKGLIVTYCCGILFKSNTPTIPEKNTITYPQVALSLFRPSITCETSIATVGPLHMCGTVSQPP